MTRSLLPSHTSSQLSLKEAIGEALDDFDDDVVSLTRLRELIISSGADGEDDVHDWYEKVGNCKVKFMAGDIGYIPSDVNGVRQTDMMDNSRFNSFVKLGNVSNLPDAVPPPGSATSLEQGYDMSAVMETTGTQMQWVNGFVQRQPTWPFVLPNEIEGYELQLLSLRLVVHCRRFPRWSVLLQPQNEISMYVRHEVRLAKVTEAWRYLLREARKLAERVGENVQPHEVILSVFYIFYVIAYTDMQF